MIQEQPSEAPHDPLAKTFTTPPVLVTMLMLCVIIASILLLYAE